MEERVYDSLCHASFVLKGPELVGRHFQKLLPPDASDGPFRSLMGQMLDYTLLAHPLQLHIDRAIPPSSARARL